MNQKELWETLKIGEGYTIEFKERLDKSLGKEMGAFANASGGRIFLGVRDDGFVKGFSYSNNIVSQIQDTAKNVDPPLNVSIEKVGDAVVVHVPEGKDKPYQAGGEFYLRQGANSQKLKRDEIRNIFQRENHLKFDRKINHDFDLAKSFDNEQFKLYCSKANIPTDLSKEHVLSNLSLLTDSKPNNACVLLFSDRISDFFLNSVISCVLYSGTERVHILDKKEFDSGFLPNFDEAVNFVLRNIRTRAIIKGRERVDVPEIPEEALREAIINAMIHRDYFSEGRVQIEIFSDRVEISNPGKLLFKEEDLGQISVSRNPILVDCMYRIKYVERIGSGVMRMKTLVPNIFFKFSSDWFRVIFPVSGGGLTGGLSGGLSGGLRDMYDLIKKNPDISRKELLSSELGERLGEKLGDNQLKIVLLMAENNKISIKDIANVLNISETAVEKHISKLQKEKIIKRVGPAKGGYWQVNSREF